MKRTHERRLILSAAAAGVLIASVGSGFAASPLKLEFVRHAAFFSAGTKQPKTLDPHVFIEDASAPEATGPQNIKHVAGVRPALVDLDAKTSKLFNAEHKPLGFDLQSWLSATGTVTIAEKDGKVTLDATFKNLQPNASYSLFENHFDTTPVSFTPMDGAGKTNSFTTKADGTASVTVALPSMPTHDNAVLVIYNSGGQPHGMERGRIGVDAHHQASRGRSDPIVSAWERSAAAPSARVPRCARKGPPSSLVQLRITTWTGDARDTRPNSDIRSWHRGNGGSEAANVGALARPTSRESA